tara:strand:+ start:433 stop:711 length:279 start_codon:yes stop_codon:yes gene_type:complete
MDIRPISEIEPKSEEYYIALEKAFRRGFADALNAAYSDPILRSAIAADVSMEMITEWTGSSGEAEQYRFGYAAEVSRRAKEIIQEEYEEGYR